MFRKIALAASAAAMVAIPATANAQYYGGYRYHHYSRPRVRTVISIGTPGYGYYGGGYGSYGYSYPAYGYGYNSYPAYGYGYNSYPAYGYGYGSYPAYGYNGYGYNRYQCNGNTAAGAAIGGIAGAAIGSAVGLPVETITCAAVRISPRRSSTTNPDPSR